MWHKADDLVVHEHDPYNAETPRARLAEVLTPVEAFYVRSHGPVPDADVDTWRVVVDGLVDHPLELSVHELQERWPHHEVTATMQCAGNRRAGFLEVRDIPGEAPWGPGATGTARWTGVRLRDVLTAAGAGDAAQHVAFEAPDVSDDATPPQPFGASIDLPKALSDEVLLAWAMNGEPLPTVHGGPLRVVVPGYIGARSVKWVRRIVVQQSPSENYFQATAYRLLPADSDGAGPGAGIELSSVALNADVISPEPGAVLDAGPMEVTGYAYAGDARTVTRVDVSVDDGASWEQAELAPPVSPWAWQHWSITIDLPPGEHTLVVRAWDTTGASMPESARQLWNPKGYVNNSWARQRIELT